MREGRAPSRPGFAAATTERGPPDGTTINPGRHTKISKAAHPDSPEATQLPYGISTDTYRPSKPTSARDRPFRAKVSPKEAQRRAEPLSIFLPHPNTSSFVLGVEEKPQ